MGHRQKMNPKQLLEWDTNSYKARLSAQKEHNYEYWNDKKHNPMLTDGWALWQFKPKGHYEDRATSSESLAKDAIEKLRTNGNFARIIVGWSQNRQKIKMYSIIYKKRKSK